jgi:hypothetical protein
MRNGTLVEKANVELGSTLSTDISIDGTMGASPQGQRCLGSRKLSKKPLSAELHPSSLQEP